MRALRSLCVLAFLVSTAHAESAPQPQEQLNQTLENLAKSKQDQAALQSKLAKVQRDYEGLQNRSTELAERLQVSERRVSNQERDLAAVNERLSTKQREFEARKSDYAATISTLLRMRELPMTAMFAQQDDVQQLMRTASVLEKTNQAVAKKAMALAKDLGELKSLRQDAAIRRERTQKEAETLGDEQEQLDKALKTRQRLQAQLAADNAEAQQKVASLSRESESLQTLIGKLDAQAKEQARLQEERAKAQQKPVVKPKPSKKFEGSKGSGRAPVSGDVIHKFGDRKSAGEDYRGVVFRARPGSTVVAPYDGQVVFTGPFRDYGNMVLIKHQNGFISLIAGVGKVTAGLNQAVIRGEPIALMPPERSAEAYVELRDSDAKPIDPSDWFANVNSK